MYYIAATKHDEHIHVPIAVTLKRQGDRPLSLYCHYIII